MQDDFYVYQKLSKKFGRSCTGFYGIEKQYREEKENYIQLMKDVFPKSVEKYGVLAYEKLFDLFEHFSDRVSAVVVPTSWLQIF